VSIGKLLNVTKVTTRERKRERPNKPWHCLKTFLLGWILNKARASHVLLSYLFDSDNQVMFCNKNTEIGRVCCDGRV